MERKTETVRARIAPKLKKDAEKILNKLGLSTTQAITLFFNQIVLQNGIPFEIQIALEERKAPKRSPKGSTKTVSIKEKDLIVNEMPVKTDEPVEVPTKSGFLFFGRNKK